jgi:2-polyprenyl-6-methoxyphenol hydroxylase-like FAD-dependent oxidoreductase
MTSELPIVILGAGLAGPAVCLSLLSSGYHCRLLELRGNAGILETTINSDGGSITLSANSIRALLQCAGGATLSVGEDLLKNGKAAALHDKLRQVGYSYDRMSLQDDGGYRYGDVSVGEGEYGGLQALRIMRGDLRKILLEECRIGGAEVEWGVKVTGIQETEHVEVFTADGMSIKGMWTHLSS